MAHKEQLQFIESIKNKYTNNFINTSVLEVGSWNIHGTVRDFFESPSNYIGLDIAPGKDVDVVCSGDQYDTDIRFNTVISCECFEHNPKWLETFINMIRLAKSGGLVIFTCATEGRAEHGTGEHKPEDSLTSTIHSYYRNLSELDFRNSVNLDDFFSVYEFSVNNESHDLYFYGIKKQSQQTISFDRHVIISGNFLTLCILKNQFFEHIKNFVLYKFDTEEYANSVIVVGGNDFSCIDSCRAVFNNKKIIAYNWEQLVDCNQWLNVSYLISAIKKADEIWDYDYLNELYLNKFYNIKVNKVVPFEYYPEMETLVNNPNPEIDLLIYGTLNERRARILASIQPHLYDKVSIVIVAGMSREATYKYIENSKVVLNLHGFEPWSRQEQERIGFLLGNKKCVISEISQENYFNGAILESRVDELLYTIKYTLENDRWRYIGLNGYDMFKNGKCQKITNY